MLAVNLLSSQKTDKLPLNADSLTESIGRLESSIAEAYQYVDDVVVSSPTRKHWLSGGAGEQKDTRQCIQAEHRSIVFSPAPRIIDSPVPCY